MVTNALVENLIEDGRQLLDRLSAEGIPVSAACLVQPDETESWSLVIVTPIRDKEGGQVAYRKVFHALQSLGTTGLATTDINVVGTEDPAAKALQTYRAELPRLLHRIPLGRVFAETVYIYPTAEVTPHRVTIYGLIYPGDPLAGLHLSFEPQNPNSSLTVENENGRNVYHARTGLDWVVATPLGATFERDHRGLKVLAWDLYGKRRQSDASTVLSLAELGLHGFRVLQKPS